MMGGEWTRAGAGGGRARLGSKHTGPHKDQEGFLSSCSGNH